MRKDSEQFEDVGWLHILTGGTVAREWGAVGLHSWALIDVDPDKFTI